MKEEIENDDLELCDDCGFEYDKKTDTKMFLIQTHTTTKRMEANQRE